MSSTLPPEGDMDSKRVDERVVRERFKCGCGLPLAPGQLVCGTCWRAAPDWMRRNVASRYANQKREAREKLLAFALSRRATTSMLVYCSYCPELLGRERVFLGSKPGEGISDGICEECAAVLKERIEGGNLTNDLSDRPEAVSGNVSSIASPTRTSLASRDHAPVDRCSLPDLEGRDQ